MTDLEHKVEVYERLKENHVQAMKQMPEGYFHFVTTLVGSQNYGIDIATSDIDSKVLIQPDPRTAVLRPTRYNSKHILEGGDTTLADCREIFRQFLKPAPNTLEILFTEYYICNKRFEHFWDRLRGYRDLIANCQPKLIMTAIKGTMLDNSKRLYADVEYYNKKKLSRIVQYHHFLRDFTETLDFGSALRPTAEECRVIQSIKTDNLSYNEVVSIQKTCMEEIEEYMKVNVPEYNGYNEAKEFLDNLAFDLFVETLSDV